MGYQQPPDDPYQQAPWQPPPGGPHQQAPGAPYQPQPPRKRGRGLKITLGIVGGVVLLIIVAAALGGGNTGTGTSTNTRTTMNTGTGNGQAAQSAGNAAVPGIGDKVRDGKFEFVVTKVSHRKSVGDTGHSRSSP